MRRNTLLDLLVMTWPAAAKPPGVASDLQWGPCNVNEVNGSLPMDCATLKVPLDYTVPSSDAMLDLQLARVPAAVQPAKGSIQFNFGGPGEPGRSGLAETAYILQQ